MILADEPTGALDVETGTSVMALLEEVTTENGAALITITHDPNVAALAGRSLRLDQGVLSPVELLPDEIALDGSALDVSHTSIGDELV